MVSYLHDLRKTSGGEHAELSFILIGGIAAVGFSLAFSLFWTTSLARRARWLFAPFRVLVLMPGSWLRHRDPQDPGSGLLHATVHGLHRLGGLLGRALLLGWWLCKAVFVPIFGEDGASLAHVLASLVIAFAMVPAHGLVPSR